MYRRCLLALGGVCASAILGGCIQPPGDDDGTSSDGVSVTVTSQADQPTVPVEYSVEMVESLATMDSPARLRVTLTNPTDSTVVLGEERAVQFHHVASTEKTLYLHPAGGETGQSPVEPGCWQLTEYVAVPEYYGTVTLAEGETTQAESYVYGHPELSEGTCLPTGDHQIQTTGVAGDDEDAFDDESALTDFEWGFTLRIED